jgi:pathogenesis-related protein 1
MVGTTAAHNAGRREKGLDNLTWDDDLAAIAAAWIAQCQGDGTLLNHNDGRSDNYPGYVGENIYAGTGAVLGTDAVASWLSEESAYNYGSDSCSGVCGHYTQVVWDSTTKVGCAIGTCSNQQFPNTIVCDYSPGGNIDGQRPY